MLQFLIFCKTIEYKGIKYKFKWLNSVDLEIFEKKITCPVAHQLKKPGLYRSMYLFRILTSVTSIGRKKYLRKRLMFENGS